MTKLIALVAVGVLAVSSAFAGGGKGCCTKQAANETKAACQVSLASLDLTPAQKTKMDALMAEHQKEGCSEASEAKYMKEAKTILNKDQYAKFKSECHGAKKDKGNTQT
jgi:Spy/CpxP family protein refolding chaperone